MLALQLVIVDEEDPLYEIELENRFNLSLFIGEGEISMLASGLKLKVKNNVLNLVSDEGVVDDTISINDTIKDKQPFVLNKVQLSS